MKKHLSIIVLSISMFVCCLGLVACGENETTDTRNQQIVSVYNTYVAYAESNGTTPLSYENWLKSIKGENGQNGINGKDGIGVKSVLVDNDGHLIITYTDDTFVDAGLVKGKDGLDGNTFTIEISADGYWVIGGNKTNVKAKGEDGKDGADGKNGQDGQNGKNGTTPTIAISNDGYWIINGETTSVKAVGTNGKDGKDGQNGADGKDGQDGENGKDGRDGSDAKQIKCAEIDVDGNLIITYKDDTTENLGKIKDNSKCEHEYSDYVINEIGDIGYKKEYFCKKCHENMSELYIYTEGIEYGLEEDGNTAFVYGDYIATDKEVVLRYSYQGKPVTRIGRYYGGEGDLIGQKWFSIVGDKCVKIIIPDSIISIENFNCNSKNLQEVVMSKNIEYIGTNSGSCSFMSHSVFNQNELRYNIFENGYYIGNEENPYLVLTGIIESKITISSFIINENCRVIMGDIFDDCWGLKSLTIPASVVGIMGRVMWVSNSTKYNNIEELVVEEGNIKYYSENNCIIDRETNTLIFGCKNSVIPAEGVETIGSYAFTKLDIKCIDIPANITSIKYDAIIGCDITEINYSGTKEQWNNIDKATGQVSSSAWGGGYKDCELWIINGEEVCIVHCLDGDIELNFENGYIFIGEN